EARRQKGREKIIDGICVEGQRRPTVLTFGYQPIVDLDRSRSQVRRLAAVRANYTDERIRLLRPRRNRPAGTMILERTPHEVDAVGEQRRGQRIAFVACVALAIEGEADRPRAIDAATRCRPERRIAHRRPSFAASIVAASGRGSPDLYVSRIRSLTVSRTALKKRPQPCTCRQRSKWMPFGLVRM